MINTYEILCKYDVVSTDMLDELGINKDQFAHFVRYNHYKRIAKGTYKFMGDDTFKLYKVNHRAKKGVLSHNTALYYHHMIDKLPDYPSLTLSVDSSTTRFNNTNIKTYKIKKEYLEWGMISTKDIFGNAYRVYDLDRTIVDLVRSRKRIGMSVLGEMLRKYLQRDDKNLDHLFIYAKAFRVDKILKSYLELLM